jgi:hypothetical protein
MKTVEWGRVLSIHPTRPAIPVPQNVDFIKGDSISDETLAILCRNCADFARPDNDRAARNAMSRV